MVAQRVDQLVLGHVGAAVDPDLGGPLLEVVLAPVLVAPGLAALLAGLVAVAVGDPRGLLLARALVAQGLVLILVLDAGAGILSTGHGVLLSVASSRGYPPRRRRPPRHVIRATPRDLPRPEV